MSSREWQQICQRRQARRSLEAAGISALLRPGGMTAEGRLQVTPVEWGILSFVLARALAWRPSFVKS